MVKFIAVLASLAAIAVPSLKDAQPLKNVAKENNLGGIHLIESNYDKDSLEKTTSAEYLNPKNETYYNNQHSVVNFVGDVQCVWDSYRGEGTTIAFIDTGIYYNHEDFVVNGKSKVSPRSRSYYHTDSGFYWAELGDQYQYASYLEPGLNNKGEMDYHGMYVSSVAASAVNGVGITGIAPEATIVMIKVDMTLDALVNGINYAADLGVDVISISQGAAGSANRSKLQTAVNKAINAGSIVVAAAGNDTSTTPWYPAACDNVIGVGALAFDNDNAHDTIYEIADYSNYNAASGDKNVDVVAPGTVLAAKTYENGVSGYTYPYLVSGTSFSAPIVAGAAALYKQKHPNATPKQFEQALYASTRDVGATGYDNYFGYGALDIGKLMSDPKQEGTTTVEQDATNIYWKDELGWCFRTLHIYNLQFADGYSYADFERYMSMQYGQQVSRDSYSFEGTDGQWARNTAGNYDYLLNPGQSGPEYNVELPWWVTQATYQYVNNSNWVNDGGCSFTNDSNRLHANNKSYIYNNNGGAAVSTVNPESGYTATYPAYNAHQTCIVGNGATIFNFDDAFSVYDKFALIEHGLHNENFDYRHLGFYTTSAHTVEYVGPEYLSSDVSFFALYLEYPGTMYFQAQGWSDYYVYQKITVSDTSYYEPFGPYPGVKMNPVEGFLLNGSQLYSADVCIIDGYSTEVYFTDGTNDGSKAVKTTYVANGSLICNNPSTGVITSYSGDASGGIEFIQALVSVINSVQASGSIKAGSVCGLASIASLILETYNSLSTAEKRLVDLSSIYTYLGSGDTKGNVSLTSIITQLQMLANSEIGSTQFTNVNADSSIIIISISLLTITFIAVAIMMKKKKLA